MTFSTNKGYNSSNLTFNKDFNFFFTIFSICKLMTGLMSPCLCFIVKILKFFPKQFVIKLYNSKFD